MPRGMYGVGVGVGTPYYYDYPGARHEAETRQECWACMIIPVTFWIFVSLTLSLGLYGTTHLSLGPNYSHYLEASPIFVKEIKVKHEGRYDHDGPMLYGFSDKPKLSIDRNWSAVHSLLVDPEYHQEIAVWLNRGSKVGLHCEVKNNGFQDVLVIVLKGRESLEEWIHSPSNPHLGEVRLKMHGHGHADYIANEDADYYFAVGNFNQRRVKVVMTLNFTSKLYETGNANYECSVRKGLCAVKLFFTGNKYAVLSTASNTTNVMNVWYVELSYGARLLTYVLILGVVVLVVYCIFRVMGHLDQPVVETETETVQETETAPLLLPKESRSESSTYGTLEQDQESGLSSSAEDLYDGKICIICYDEPRNCFFIPCGHCATCYTCAQRIEINEGKSCPICRQGIVKVKRLFNA